MPEKNTLHKAGDYILEGPLMAGSSGENFSFQDIVSEINIYQDIDSPYMSGSIFVTEAAGLYERMPMNDLLDDNNFFNKIKKIINI